MSVEIDPAYLPEPIAKPPQPAKRFFRCEEQPWGEPWYIVVAKDLEDAKRILRESHCEFGDPSMPYDKAEATYGFDWEEMSDESVARRMVDKSDEGSGRVPLVDCSLGEWFCSEY